MTISLGEVGLWLLDGLFFGIVFLDEELGILYRNRAALLLDGRLSQGSLPAEWRAAVDQREAHKSITLNDGQPIEAQLLVAPPRLRASGVCSVLSLRAPSRSEYSLELLQQLFSLTFAEARLTRRLLQGATLKKAAEQLEVSTETVRSQLKSIFSKTDTRRQAELILRLSPPLFLWPQPQGAGSKE